MIDEIVSQLRTEKHWFTRQMLIGYVKGKPVEDWQAPLKQFQTQENRDFRRLRHGVLVSFSLICENGTVTEKGRAVAAKLTIS